MRGIRTIRRVTFAASLQVALAVALCFIPNARAESCWWKRSRACRCDNGVASQHCVDTNPMFDAPRRGTRHSSNSREEEQAVAASLFNRHCIRCHGVDGRGVSDIPGIPNFSNVRFHASRSDGQLARAIMQGRGAVMPPHRGVLSLDEARALARYVRGFAPGTEISHPNDSEPSEVDGQPVLPAPRDPPPEDASEETAARIGVGRGIFRRFCIDCHGADGTGSILRGQIPRIPDFTNPTWQKQNTDHKVAVSIRDGKGTSMPAHRGRISDGQARDLVAYIRAFGPRELRTISRRRGSTISQGRASTSITGRRSETEFEKSFRELEQEWNELEMQKIELAEKES